MSNLSRVPVTRSWERNDSEGGKKNQNHGNLKLRYANVVVFFSKQSRSATIELSVGWQEIRRRGYGIPPSSHLQLGRERKNIQVNDFEKLREIDIFLGEQYFATGKDVTLFYAQIRLQE
ncbi:hypothetical protein NPIL_426031 [Nephila pilipes]|uniref:Uncharacterized protein n=1 Tax=Nephila pilipes TaxID=299642 RepID=A0A8X6NAH2_NEPPI|nr:hypothetical protein NPIL_426031 [Nephila pilipes]